MCLCALRTLGRLVGKRFVRSVLPPGFVTQRSSRSQFLTTAVVNMRWFGRLWFLFAPFFLFHLLLFPPCSLSLHPLHPSASPRNQPVVQPLSSGASPVHCDAGNERTNEKKGSVWCTPCVLRVFFWSRTSLYLSLYHFVLCFTAYSQAEDFFFTFPRCTKFCCIHFRSFVE